MSFLLDTDVISQVTKSVPDPATMTWLAAHPVSRMHLSVMSLLEIRSGIGTMPAGKKSQLLSAWLDLELPALYANRILPVTAEIALDAGRLIAQTHIAGHTADPNDAIIAATARIHGYTLVTRNRRHFERLDVPIICP